MASPGWRFREMERTNHMHEFAKVCVHPISQHPSPSSVPIRSRVSNGGVAVSFLLLEGMGDWILASPRLSGFLKPELAVSWGGGLKGHSEVKGANTEMCQDLGETPPGISRWPCVPFLGITGR